MSMARNIKFYREKINKSQKKLAEEADVSTAYIGFLETGDRKNPSYDVLKKIAFALEVTVNDLIEEKEDDQCVTTENK